MLCIVMAHDCCSGGCGRGILNVHAASRPVGGMAGFSFALVLQLRWFRVCVPTVVCVGEFGKE